MKIVLLPGLDGTGILFEPFVKALSPSISTQIIRYPTNKLLSYEALTAYALNQLPDEDYILLGESFSGPIAYKIALTKPVFLKSLIFIATFLNNPRPFTLNLANFLSIRALLSHTPPTFILKLFLFGGSIDDKTLEVFKQILQKMPPAILSFRLKEIAALTKPNIPIEIPALYIQATKDKLVLDDSITIFKTLFNNLKIIKIKSPHFILQAFPKQCAEIIIHEIE